MTFSTNTAILNVLCIKQPYTKQIFIHIIQIWSKKPIVGNCYYLWGIGHTNEEFWLGLRFLRQMFNVYGTLSVRFEVWVTCFKL